MYAEQNWKFGVTKTKQPAPAVELNGNALTPPPLACSTVNMRINAEQ
jgi:hypothetical protein